MNAMLLRATTSLFPSTVFNQRRFRREKMLDLNQTCAKIGLSALPKRFPSYSKARHWSGSGQSISLTWRSGWVSSVKLSLFAKPLTLKPENCTVGWKALANRLCPGTFTIRICRSSDRRRPRAWMPTIRHIAFGGRCFVVSACQYIRRGDYPTDYPAIQGNDSQIVLMRGGSLIVNPLGSVLTGPDYSAEKILTADLRHSR